MFLTHEELARLTGYTRASAQIRWLREHGYKLEVNGLGKPVVAVAEYTRKNVGGSASRQQEPNWGAMQHGTTAAR